MEKFPDAHALLRDAVDVRPPMQLTRADLERVHRPAASLVVLYGGGYHRSPGKTGSLHAQTIRRAAQAL